MSAPQLTADERVIVAAKADLKQYIDYFEKTYGYGIKIQSSLELIKLESTPPNGNKSPKEARKSNSGKRRKGKA